ncbi:MAG: succinylglutamate desuccinylase/aspartoacylase family protein [Gemmatimonadota bacterium]|nr:succinylglutamate desuccinylase/aspartoacylase family protein [Gemmatimonadota bacterium]
MPTRRRKHAGSWRGRRIPPGDRANLAITVSRNYAGAPIKLPIHVWRGKKRGPTVFITAGVHGDELNGTGVIRELILDPPFELVAGSLILVPVLNILAFDRLSRYSPDRRDLNRCFPGLSRGSLTSRLARAVHDNIVSRSDYGIDLHTAAARRTNFPNVRADLTDADTARLAELFGGELVIDTKGPPGTLRREAQEAGCPTIVLEAGEVWKVEPAVVEYTLHGIESVLAGLGMIEGKIRKPPYRVVAEERKWIRATAGGFLQFHVRPGDMVAKDAPLATNTSLVGEIHNVLTSPDDAIVLGMTTLPAVLPGDPVCHLAFPSRGTFKRAERALGKLSDSHVLVRLHGDLGSSVLVSEKDPE